MSDKSHTFQNDEHQARVLEFEEYADGTIECRQLMDRCRDYFDGKQLTDDEIKTLKARGQPPIIDNKIRDKCETLLGIEKQQRTDPKAFPRNPQDESSAEVATDTLRYVADQNQYHEKVRKPAANNLIIDGVCAGQVVVEKRKPYAKICMEEIRRDRLFYDIRSLKDDFSDKNYCGYFTWMDYEDALDMWPKAKDVLDQSWAGESGQSEQGPDESMDDKPRYVMTARKRKRLQVFTHYFKQKGKWHFCTWCRGGFLDEPKVSTYKDDSGDPACCIEIQALYRDSEGGPYGVVSRYLDLQDEHNKRRSKIMHLLSTRQVVAENGAFDDIAEARKEMHKPDGVISPNPGFKWEMHTNMDLAQGQFRMLEYTDLQLSQVGPNAALGGTSGNISGIAKARDQQAGQLPISPLFDALDFWELRMYRQVWMRARQFWKGEMFIRVTDDEEKVRFVGLNQTVLQGDKMAEALKAEQIPPQEKQAVLQQIAQDPRSQMPVVGPDGRPQKKNELAQMDMDIIIERGQDVVNVQQEEFMLLAEVAKGRPEVPFDVLLEISQLRSDTKKRVLDRMKGADDPAAQQQAQFQQMMRQLQGLLLQAQVRKESASAAKDEAAAIESQVDASVKVAEFTDPTTKQPAAKTQVSVN